MEEIPNLYNKLKAKYNLPEFAELDMEFSISDIEGHNFLARKIIGKMTERIDEFSCVLDGILQPDSSSVKGMAETCFYDDTEKKELYSLHRRVMALLRKSLDASLTRDEKVEAEYIAETFAKWKALKICLRPLLLKLSSSWLSENTVDEKLGYMG